MAKVGKDPRCEEHLWKRVIGTCHWAPASSALRLLSHSDFSHQTFLGNVSAIMDVVLFFFKGSGAQMNSFAFHELQVESFLAALPRAAASLTSVCHFAAHHIVARWLNVGADGVEHAPRPSSRTTFRFLCRGEALSHGGPWRQTWLRTALGARGRARRQCCHVFMTGTKRHKLHYYLCTTT